MKAVRYHSYGDSSVLVHEDAERPVAGPGEVVLRVAGTAFNPVDSMIRAGALHDVFSVTFPHIPNYDVAGVITEVGEGVSRWSVGDAVVAFLWLGDPGAAAEYVAAPAGILAAAPRTVALPDAAALPSVGLAAWQSLFEHARLERGQRVLINGAGGAVGSYAVQLAARAGITVTAVASAGSLGRLHSYGADEIADRRVTSVLQGDAGRDFDAVLNLAPANPAETVQLAGLAAEGGIFVTTSGPVPEVLDRAVRTARVFTRSDAAQLGELVSCVDAGDLQIWVADRRPLAELSAVHAEADAGRLPGRTVLTPSG